MVCASPAAVDRIGWECGDDLAPLNFGAEVDTAPCSPCKWLEGREEAPECYICTESVPAPVRSECLCTNRYMHAACFAKLLETRGNALCGVCGAPYANVRCTTRRSVAVRSPCVAVVLLASCTLGVFGCWVRNWVVLWTPGPTRAHLWVAQVVMGMGMGAGSAVISAFCEQLGVRALWETGFAERKVFLVSEPLGST